MKNERADEQRSIASISGVQVCAYYKRTIFSLQIRRTDFDELVYVNREPRLDKLTYFKMRIFLILRDFLISKF